MAATKDELRRWFEVTKARPGTTHMVVLCDTYDWSDYPYACYSRDHAQRIVDHPGDMQQVMEVYDLNADMEEQMAEHRAWRL